MLSLFISKQNFFSEIQILNLWSFKIASKEKLEQMKMGLKKPFPYFKQKMRKLSFLKLFIFFKNPHLEYLLFLMLALFCIHKE